MKKILAVAAVVLLIGLSIWFCLNRQTTVTIVAPYEISAAGTLVSVSNGIGAPLLNPETPLNEGYVLSYRLLDQNTKEPKGAEKLIYAVDRGYSTKSIRCPECEKRKLQSERAAQVLSMDSALMVATNFIFDAKTKRLKVYRLIKNISNEPEVSNPVTVKLLAIQLQYNSVLASGSPTQLGMLKPKKDAVTTTTEKTAHSIFRSLLPTAQAIEHACQWCPPECEFILEYAAKERGQICVDCPDVDAAVRNTGVFFQGGKIVTSNPGHDDTHPPINCDHIIIVEPFMGKLGEVGVITTKSDQSQIVCITCPQRRGEEITKFSAVSYSNVGLLTPSGVRATYGCDVAVQINDGESAKAELKYEDRKKMGRFASYQQPDSLGIQKTGKETQTRYKDQLEPGEGIVLLVEYDLGKDRVKSK
ncbi:MAG TPA: hypothetical protein PLD20_06995 [Blastocatellia bacterium]|nr:hypothetical protein [Blastocatellia bacterium]HMX26380.1 hypothetical protein [Blastocatellia bacterium]HMY71217.1 hypothetical protein [Blastocatellia bacterium]HMZ17656.1 hypothetical protein [Blastocatellia bacterium]HNG29321.1 hypothetical protein [Blastocatellia bacterium]